ncbi:hypothetical protein BLSTO_06103 [Blastocystis sp. subtype 1]
MPIDINLLRVSRGGNPELVRQSQRNRFASVELVDEVIALDDKWRSLTGMIDNMKKEKRILSTAIGKKRKAGEDSTEETQKVKEITDKITETEKEVEATRVQRDAKLKKIGNILSDTCIIDKNEDNNGVVWKCTATTSFCG